jgi:hypothetical protein
MTLHLEFFSDFPEHQLFSPEYFILNYKPDRNNSELVRKENLKCYLLKIILSL